MSDLEKKDSLSSNTDPEQQRPVVILEADPDAHRGVIEIEAAERVYGKYSKWVLFISLGLASYSYSLDGTTTFAYLTFATSAFGGHSLIASVQTAQAIVVAVGKPVVAKLADVSSRATAYIITLTLYTLGYVLVAAAPNIGTVAAGCTINDAGYTGIQLLTQVLVADVTTLRWRGLVNGLMFSPFIINGFVGSNISAEILEHSGWRWGYGMFAILLPGTLLPLIVTLYWAQFKAKRLGIVDEYIPPRAKDPEADYTGKTKRQVVIAKLWRLSEQMDLIGLVFLAAATALILLPLTLSRTARGGWENRSIIAMLVVGIVALGIFVYWEYKYASKPVIPPRFLRNRTVVICAFIGFWDFISFYLTTAYLFAFIIVVKPWPILHVNYFGMTQNVGMTVFGIMGGIAMLYFRRYKPFLTVGLAIRLIGVGLMIRSRGARGSTFELVFTQILQAIGGGLASLATTVGTQASVTHADMATATAGVLLFTTIGGAVGNAIAGAIWVNMMPDQLAKHLPFATEEQRAVLFGNIPAVLSFPPGHPVREGVIEAYSEVMRISIIVATVVAIFPWVMSFFLPNWYLSDMNNAIEGAFGDGIERPPPATTAASTADKKRDEKHNSDGRKDG